jgi:hypothetical protein
MAGISKDDNAARLLPNSKDMIGIAAATRI